MDIQPNINVVETETEEFMNKFIRNELDKQNRLINDGKARDEKFFAKFNGKVPLDPLYKEYIDQLELKNSDLQNKIDSLLLGNEPDYEYINNLIKTMSQVSEITPENYNKLQKKIENIQSETNKILNEEIPALIAEYERVASTHNHE